MIKNIEDDNINAKSDIVGETRQEDTERKPIGKDTVIEKIEKKLTKLEKLLEETTNHLENNSRDYSSVMIDKREDITHRSRDTH